MARVTYVKSARKDQGSCLKCGTQIRKGDSYKWFANRIGRSSITKKFCSNCSIRASDQTTSPNLATLYGAIEAGEDAIADASTLDEFAAALETAAEGVRETQQMYEESAQNIVDGFGHETSMSEEIMEKAQECESFADELESAQGEIENLDDPDADEEDFLSEYEGETDDDGKPIDKDDFEQFVEEKREERREAVREAADAALSNSPM